MPAITLVKEGRPNYGWEQVATGSECPLSVQSATTAPAVGTNTALASTRHTHHGATVVSFA